MVIANGWTKSADPLTIGKWNGVREAVAGERDVDDPHGGALGAAWLQAQGLVLVGGDGHCRAQAGGLAVGRVLDLYRKLFAVVRVDRGRDLPSA